MHFSDHGIGRLLALAIEAAIGGGREIMAVYQKVDVDIRIKDDQSPVTEADVRSHHLIVDKLQQTGIPVLSEEGVEIPLAERSGWQSLWVVDPLDGTKEFIKRNGEFTVNIALVENQRPMMGIIFVPVKGLLYIGYGKTARKYVCADWLHHPDGSFVKHASFDVLPCQKNVPLTAVASISHPNRETTDYLERVRRRLGSMAICSVGSSLKFCLLAEGGAHLYPRFGRIMEWDTAAGQAILEATGGEVLALPELEPMLYNREDLKNPYFIALGAGVDRAVLGF